MGEPGRLLPRRMGIGVVPVPCESFPSWVDRMAIRMGTGPGWVVRELGIERRSWTGSGEKVVLPEGYGISMSRRDLESVSAATGVAPDMVSTMLLSVYDGTVLDLSSVGPGTVGGQVWKREWALFRGSRCCPDCVAAAEGAWQLWWRLGGVAACPQHRVLLHGQCPGCGLPLRWNNSRLPTRTPYPTGGLTACLNRNASNNSTCGFPLAELPSRPAPAEVLEVQDLYLRAAAGQPLHLAGKDMAPADWFAELRQLVALARLAGPQDFPGADALPGLCARAWREDHAAEEAGRSWLWRTYPSSPELAAALLQVVAPVLRAASEQEFRDAASWLMSMAYGRRESRNVRGFDLKILPPFTRRAFLTSPHRGTSRVFLGKLLHPEPQLERLGVTAAHIPCYADEDDVLEQVAPHLTGPHGAGPRIWSQRRFAALCLVIMVTGTQSWSGAAEELGLRLSPAGRMPRGNVLVADLLAFRDGIVTIGSRLAERGLVDYRARRAALADLTEVPAADWAGRPSTAGIRQGHPDRGRVFAAAWIWSEFTGGCFNESPAWAALTGPSAPAMPIGLEAGQRPGTFYGSWLLRQSPARRDWLRAWGTRYLEDHGCPSPPR